MTGLGSGAPGRDSTTDEAPRRGFGWQILAILAIALVFRLMMAYGFDALRGSGFKSDLDLFRFWADNLGKDGPFGFYDRDFFADYTPGYLYALWLVGVVGQLIGGVGDLIKLPAIITDVVLGLVVYLMARDLGVSERRSTIAGAVVVLNPITWFDSVVWGQVDSFGTVFLLLSVRELWKARSERAAILAVVAALVKPQLAILVPIVAAVTIRRALWPDGGFGSESAPEPSGFRWERRMQGPIRILSTAIAGFVTAVALSAPFGLSVISFSTTAPFIDSSLLRLIFSTASTYSYVSVNAYNLWALFPVNGESMATSRGWQYDAPVPDATSWAAIGPLPAAVVGGALLALLLFVVVPVLVARRPDRLTILVGVSVLALAFFAVPTRVHERYLFPLFALAAIPIAFSWRWRVFYVIASVATFLNMYAVLTTIYPNNPSISDWLGIGDAITSQAGVSLIAVLHTAAFLWAFAQLRPGAQRTFEAELEHGRQPDAWDEPPDLEPVPAGAMAFDADGPPIAAPTMVLASATGGYGAPVAATYVANDGGRAVSARRLVPAWFDRPGWSDVGPIAWIRGRINETPIRPDRSRPLGSEGRGHLDRLDLWLLVVLFVAAMCLRTYRLAEPARMHFDEVYHARTAAEFLQDWRYGLSHYIYEWTHPHLAKYAMAGGIVLFAGHDTAATSDLGTPVRDAAIEPRRPDPDSATARDGDRVWVVTGSALSGYDLETRKLVASWPIDGASAITWDNDGTRLLVGTDGGEILALDTTQLDGNPGGGPNDLPFQPESVATLDGPISDLATFDGGLSVAAQLPGDTITIVDPGTGEVTGSVVVAGAVDMADSGSADAVVAVPADIADPSAAADKLAPFLGGDAADYEPLLAATDKDRVVIGPPPDDDQRKAFDAAVADGSLEGITVEPVPQLAVAGSDGVTFLDDAGSTVATVPLEGGAHGLALVSDVEDGTQLYVTSQTGTSADPELAIVGVTGKVADAGPVVIRTMPLPAAGTKVVFDAASEMVEVQGTTQDGSASTVYVVETHGSSVFADQRVPFMPVALALDHDENYPTGNRGQLLAFGSSGEMGSLDVGHYPFAWRLPGVLMGALTVAALFLLTRILFRRRTVAVLVGLFAILDGMFFVQSRIAMNDVYTGFFIIAAYAVFAWLWIDKRPRWAFWTLMPVIGMLLGLALASKWVAAYAIGALGILILARSALGRLVLIIGMIGLTSVLGWMAIAVPAGSGASGNLLFTMIMIALTLATVVVSVYHPIAWSDEEMWAAVAAPAALGILVALGSTVLGKADKTYTVGPVGFTPLEVAFALIVAAFVAYLAFQVAGRLGFGPMAPAPGPGDPRANVPPASPPATGWLRPGWALGIPIVWMLGSLLAIPLVVYVISYIPWALIEGHQLFPGWPPGHTGQTLLDLTGAMYRYHNDLTAPHAASSPWWAWPLNLKPVWFYQGSFANSTAASIYDAGNVVLWWMGIPAMAFVAYQAFKRRSLPLMLILVGFLCQWISWARIDRAAFQYHYYTSLPFLFMALAYFIAELWHGPSRRTWLLARVAAVLALFAPIILWLIRKPVLCNLANVEAVNPGSAACHGDPGNLVVTPSAATLAIVAIVTLVVLVRLLMNLGRPRADGTPVGPRDLLPLALTAIIGGVVIALTRALPSDTALFSVPGIVPELIALIAAVPLALVGLQVVTARDARRFAAGFVIAAGIWFVVLYPNIAALPLPAAMVNAYQGILPTYLYAFQFSVNTLDRSGAISFADPKFVILVSGLAVACAVVAYSTWVWRMALADDDAAVTGDTGGPEGAAGPPEGAAGPA